jgi:hypothetical protein
MDNRSSPNQPNNPYDQKNPFKRFPFDNPPFSHHNMPPRPLPNNYNVNIPFNNGGGGQRQDYPSVQGNSNNNHNNNMNLNNNNYNQDFGVNNQNMYNRGPNNEIGGHHLSNPYENIEEGHQNDGFYEPNRGAGVWNRDNRAKDFERKDPDVWDPPAKQPHRLPLAKQNSKGKQITKPTSNPSSNNANQGNQAGGGAANNNNNNNNANKGGKGADAGAK